MLSIELYRQTLAKIDDWDAYLQSESRLPGARSNLELMYAVADLTSEQNIQRWLDLTPTEAPENTPACFLACCGVISLGRLLCEGNLAWFEVLRQKANDPRWRVRESVCMALQRYGKEQMNTLLTEMRRWSEGTLLEQRAAAVGLCEPALLKSPEQAREILGILDGITHRMCQVTNRRQDDFKTLRQGMAYCWSVAAAALPETGKKMMESWIESTDADIRWIMKENLKKNRLQKMDPAWVQQWTQKMETMK